MEFEELEKFWCGEFGDEYIKRNQGNELLSANIALFSKIIGDFTEPVKEIIEFGSNIGMNLLAIKALMPSVEISAIEINKSAAIKCRELINPKNLYEGSIMDFQTDYQRDMVLIKGVLIHMHPDVLQEVYQKLYDTSKKYICICEYYNPVPVEVNYRGQQGKLFKRDFCGEMLDKFSDLELIDYGFLYHRDNMFLQDDLSWFLLKKKNCSK